MTGGADDQGGGISLKLVPVEGIEPPTFGLQNRCSTAELNRRWDMPPRYSEFSLSRLAKNAAPQAFFGIGPALLF